MAVGVVVALLMSAVALTVSLTRSAADPATPSRSYGQGGSPYGRLP